VASGMVRSLAKHLFMGATEALPTRSHRSARGEALLPHCSFVEPLIRLPDVFRHFIGLVRVAARCVEFAAWAPDLLLLPGDPHRSFLFGQMWPHMLTKWPPLAARRAQFLSTENARISRSSGLSNAGRWLGQACRASILVICQADDDWPRPCVTRPVQSLFGALSLSPAASLRGPDG
jgi:hypothetical protein